MRCKRPGCGTSSSLLLGKICKEWREIAWNTPTLWRWIDITVSGKRYGTQKQLETKIQLLEEWLQRAKDELLLISVRPEIGYEKGIGSANSTAGGMAPARQGSATADQFSSKNIFKLLADYSVQWKAFDIVFPDDCTPILNGVRGHIPFLESVVINTSGNMVPGRTLDFLADAPSLRTLNCTFVKVGQDVKPWPKLISLTTRGDILQAIILLKLAPNLEYCRIESADDRSQALATRGQQSNSNDDPSTISLHHLTSLVIKDCMSFRFLSVMEAPSLRRLSIIQGFQLSFEPLIDFVHRSRCKLIALGLSTSWPFDVVGLQNLLSRSDSVTRLYIESKKASDYQALMRKIPKMLDPSAGILLPNLQVFYYSTIDPVRSQEMIDMIKLRWKGQELGGSDSVLPGKVAKLGIVRFKKSTLKPLLDPLQEEIGQGLEVTYDLPYKGEPFE